MFPRIAILVGMIGGMLAVVGLCLAVQIDGYCYLENQVFHQETKVLFQADSPSALTDSTFTDISGYYQIDLAIGLYDVFFTHEGFTDEQILDQLFTTNTTLDTITLSIISLSGALSGILVDSVYVVGDDISVQAGDSLIIEPGVILLFNGHYVFDVHGYLHCVGTEEDSIKFMTNEGIVAWQGLDFHDSASDSCLLKFCYITGSDSSGIYCSNTNFTISQSTICGNYVFGFGAGIYCYESNLTIRNCVIRENIADISGGGIYCLYSDPSIVECIISGNWGGSCGGGIRCSASHPIIMNCTIVDNSAYFYGGGIGCGGSNPIIDHCTISGNSVNSDGGGIFIENGSGNISNCTISENISEPLGEGGGIYFYGSQINISNCYIYDNTASDDGGGVYHQSVTSTCSIDNCTISGNSTDQSGGGIYSSGIAIDHCTISGNSSGSDSCFHGGGVMVGFPAVIVNSIVEGNVGNGGVYIGWYEDVSITYSDFYGNEGGDFGGYVPQYLGQVVTTNINGDSCDIFCNIYLDPLFHPTTGDSAFYLTENSPCIDAGDPNSPLDPDSTIADMGAFYYDQSIPAVGEDQNRTVPREFCLLPSFPNPFNATITLSFTLPRPTKVQLQIHNISGWLIARLADGWREAGSHEVGFDGSELTSGIYICKLQAGRSFFCRKMMLLK